MPSVISSSTKKIKIIYFTENHHQASISGLRSHGEEGPGEPESSKSDTYVDERSEAGWLLEANSLVVCEPSSPYLPTSSHIAKENAIEEKDHSNNIARTIG